MAAITKEYLEKRIVELTQSRDQLIQQATAHDGAIQMCQGLLKEIQTPEIVAPPQETNQC